MKRIFRIISSTYYSNGELDLASEYDDEALVLDTLYLQVLSLKGE